MKKINTSANSATEDTKMWKSMQERALQKLTQLIKYRRKQRMITHMFDKTGPFALDCNADMSEIRSHSVME